MYYLFFSGVIWFAFFYKILFTVILIFQAESVVNAGPAVYISPSGPNPIMVQVCHLCVCLHQCKFIIEVCSIFDDQFMNLGFICVVWWVVFILIICGYASIRVHHWSLQHTWWSFTERSSYLWFDLVGSFYIDCFWLCWYSATFYFLALSTSDKLPFWRSRSFFNSCNFRHHWNWKCS